MSMTTIDKASMQGRLDKMSFDFAEKIAPVYKLLDWKWFNSREGAYGMFVPTQGEIYCTICSLINELSDIKEGKEESFCSTGGIKVWYNNRGGCGIAFIAESQYYGKNGQGEPIQNSFWKKD